MGLKIIALSLPDRPTSCTEVLKKLENLSEIENPYIFSITATAIQQDIDPETIESLLQACQNTLSYALYNNPLSLLQDTPDPEASPSENDYIATAPVTALDLHIIDAYIETSELPDKETRQSYLTSFYNLLIEHHNKLDPSVFCQHLGAIIEIGDNLYDNLGKRDIAEVWTPNDVMYILQPLTYNITPDSTPDLIGILNTTLMHLGNWLDKFESNNTFETSKYLPDVIMILYTLDNLTDKSPNLSDTIKMLEKKLKAVLVENYSSVVSYIDSQKLQNFITYQIVDILKYLRSYCKQDNIGITSQDTDLTPLNRLLVESLIEALQDNPTDTLLIDALRYHRRALITQKQYKPSTL